MSPRHALWLVAAAGAWAPEAEFATLHGTSQATWRGRVDAELDRSLNALPQRTTKDESVHVHEDASVDHEDGLLLREEFRDEGFGRRRPVEVGERAGQLGVDVVEPVRGVGSVEGRVLGGGRPALVECHLAAGGTDTWRRRGEACGEEGEEDASSHEAW